jgi:hypothetical protein
MNRGVNEIAEPASRLAENVEKPTTWEVSALGKKICAPVASVRIEI